MSNDFDTATTWENTSAIVVIAILRVSYRRMFCGNGISKSTPFRSLLETSFHQSGKHIRVAYAPALCYLVRCLLNTNAHAMISKFILCPQE